MANQTNQLDYQKFLQNSEEVKCKECGGLHFESAFMFRKQSKLYTAATEDTVLPMQIFICKDCNAPLEELMPN